MVRETVREQTAPERAATKRLYSQLRPQLEEILQSVCLRLRQLLEEQGSSPSIKYRVKRFDNFFGKLIKLGKRPVAEQAQVTDLLGLRVVCPFLEDLDAVERLIADHFEVVELERKGDRHSFREFGYDSVHLLIRVEAPPLQLPRVANVCEIQLRTILQDAWAEVEHELVYKSDIDFPKETIKRKLASLNASLTLSDLIFQEIRDYQKEVRARGLQRRQSVEKVLSGPLPISIDRPLELGESGDLPAAAGPAEETVMGLEKSMFKALEAHSNHEFSLAVQIYSRILRMKLETPLRSLVYNHRGMALFSLGEYERALGNFSKAIHYDSGNARAYCNRGLVYRVQQRFDQSLEDYGCAIRLSPDRLDGYWGRAQTCYEMKLFSMALEDCRRVLELQADFRPAAELRKAIQRGMF